MSLILPRTNTNYHEDALSPHTQTCTLSRAEKYFHLFTCISPTLAHAQTITNTYYHTHSNIRTLSCIYVCNRTRWLLQLWVRLVYKWHSKQLCRRVFMQRWIYTCSSQSLHDMYGQTRGFQGWIPLPSNLYQERWHDKRLQPDGRRLSLHLVVE